MLQELLVSELQDLLHAEGQLLKALPKMAKAAHDLKLKTAFETHLTETEGQVERLNQAFGLLDAKIKAKPCKAMLGLVEEGEETIAEGKEKGNDIADLALIVAAQKVEHYEMSGYGSARAIAGYQYARDGRHRNMPQDQEPFAAHWHQIGRAHV